MVILVEIADRLYDYTDEEKAAEAVAEFQAASGLEDEAIVAVWGNESDPRRSVLETLIFEAVDLNGPAKRARDNVPGGIVLTVAEGI